MSSPVDLVEFLADDAERARRFWTGLPGVQLAERHLRGYRRANPHRSNGIGPAPAGPKPRGPVSIPYLAVADLAEALARVPELGGTVIHPGERWAICRDSEGSPFGLTERPPTS